MTLVFASPMSGPVAVRDGACLLALQQTGQFVVDVDLARVDGRVPHLAASITRRRESQRRAQRPAALLP